MTNQPKEQQCEADARPRSQSAELTQRSRNAEEYELVGRRKRGRQNQMDDRDRALGTGGQVMRQKHASDLE
jgi:hypothetical protein